MPEDKPTEEKPEAPKTDPKSHTPLKIEIKEKKGNPLLKREEVLCFIDHRSAPTPPRPALKSELSRMFKTNEDVIVIDRIDSENGQASSRSRVYIYKTAQDIPKYMIKTPTSKKKINKPKDK